MEGLPAVRGTFLRCDRCQDGTTEPGAEIDWWRLVKTNGETFDLCPACAHEAVPECVPVT